MRQSAQKMQMQCVIYFSKRNKITLAKLAQNDYKTNKNSGLIRYGGLKRDPPFLLPGIKFFRNQRMRQTPLEQKITKIAEPIIADMGFDLVCVRITGESGATAVQVMAQDPVTKRLGVEDAAKISRSLSAVFDVEDPINGAYRLEVSSPGIDRLLIKKKDFEDYTGFEAKLELATPNKNGQRRFRGIITGIKDDVILLKSDQGEDVELPYSELTKAKLVLTDELIKATANL